MSGGIYQALRKRFKAPEWGLLFEVSNRTGFGRNRSADALAMSLWPSRGLSLHGIEIKVHRSDWRRELRDPSKSAPIQAYCDYWWIVAPRGVLEMDELPETWGYLEQQKSRLIQKKEAPKLDSKAIDKGFLAAVFRRSAEAQDHFVMRTEIAEELAAARQEGNDAAEAAARREIERWRRQYLDLCKVIEDFEADAGIKINRHRAGPCGQHFAAAQRTEELERRMEDLHAMRHRLDTMVQSLDGLFEGVGFWFCQSYSCKVRNSDDDERCCRCNAPRPPGSK